MVNYLELDITSNPLVALFFACKNYGDSACDEGMVFVFHINSDEIAYADSDRALLLSCLPRFSMTDKNHLIDAAIKYLSDESFPLDNQRYDQMEHRGSLLRTENILVTMQLHGAQPEGYRNAGQSDQHHILCNENTPISG